MRLMFVWLVASSVACGANTVDGFEADAPSAPFSFASAVAPTNGRALIGWGDKCLDVNGNDASNGTKIQLWSCNDGPAQAWSYDGSTMRAGNGKCLDIPGNGQYAGAALELYDCNGSDAQKWTRDVDQLKSTNGYCMDASGWDTADGTTIALWYCTGGGNQVWRWENASGGGDVGGGYLGGGPTNGSIATIRGVYCGNDPNDVRQYEGWLGAEATRSWVTPAPQAGRTTMGRSVGQWACGTTSTVACSGRSRSFPRARISVRPPVANTMITTVAPPSSSRSSALARASSTFAPAGS